MSAEAVAPTAFRVGNLEVSGPSLTATNFTAGEKVIAVVTVKNFGFKAAFEARLEIKSPSGDVVYNSRDASDGPKRKIRLERDGATTLTFPLNAPAAIGIYTYRLRVRNVFINTWQLREPEGEVWGPLFEVVAATGGGPRADTVLVPLPPQVQAGNAMQFQLRGSGLSGLIAAGAERLRVEATAPDKTVLPAFLVEQSNPAMIQFRSTIPAGAPGGQYQSIAYFGDIPLVIARFNVIAKPVETANTPPRIISVRAGSGNREFTPGVTISGESNLTVIFRVEAEDSDGIVAWQFDPGSTGSKLENVPGPTGIGPQTVTITHVYEPGKYSPSIAVKDGSHQDKDRVAVVEKDNFYRIEVAAATRAETVPVVAIRETEPEGETQAPSGGVKVAAGPFEVEVSPAPVQAGQIVTFHLAGPVPSTAPGPAFHGLDAEREHARLKREFLLKIIRITGPDRAILLGTGGSLAGLANFAESTTVKIPLPDTTPAGTYKAFCVFPGAFADDVPFEITGTSLRPPPLPSVETLRGAVTAMLAAYERKDAATINAMVGSDYHGVTEGGGSLDRALLARSLTFDFAQIENIALTSSVDRVDQSADVSIVALSWSVKYTHIATGASIEEAGRSTSLTFRSTSAGWMLVGQAGSPLFGRSDPVTGLLAPPQVLAAIEQKRLADEARRRAEQLAGTTLPDTTPKLVVWSADDFVKNVQAAADAMITAYEREDATTLMSYVSKDYRGVNSLGANVDYFSLPLSLQGDFQIFDNFKYTAATESFRVYKENRQAEVILIWDAQARYLATNEDILERARRTRLVFVDEDGIARLLNQDIATVTNGTVMFGQADQSSGRAIVRADQGSTSPVGTVVAVSSSGGTTTAGTVTAVDSGVLSGTVSADRTISTNATIDADVTIPSGVTLTVASGVTLTVTGNFKVDVFGTLNATNATVRSSVASPGSWQGVNFQSGSMGSIVSCTVRDAVNGIQINGGNPSISGATLTNNTAGLRLTSGNLTVNGGTIQSNTSNEIITTGGSLTLTGGLTINAANQAHNGVQCDAGTVTTTGSVTITGAGAGSYGLKLASGSHTLGSGLSLISNNIGLNIAGGATVTATGISVTNSTACGALVAGTLNANSGSSFSDNNVDGVTMQSGGTLNASGAVFNGNGRDGVNLQAGGTLNATSASNFNRNLAHGVYADLGGGNISVTNCNIQSNTDTGVMGNYAAATSNGWYLFSNHCSTSTDIFTTVPTSMDSCPQYGGMTSVIAPRNSPN